MNLRTYVLVCATVFAAIALGHLTRLILAWDMVIAGWIAPQWISVPGLIIAGGLATWGFVHASRPRLPAAHVDPDE